METHKKLNKPTPLLSIKPNSGNPKKPKQIHTTIADQTQPWNPKQPDQSHTTVADQARNTQPHENPEKSDQTHSTFADQTHTTIIDQTTKRERESGLEREREKKKSQRLKFKREWGSLNKGRRKGKIRNLYKVGFF